MDPAADYRVTLYRTYEPEVPQMMKGADLQKFTVAIADRPGSVLVEYCCLKGGTGNQLSNRTPSGYNTRKE
jgi:hypothetical protein